MAEESPPSFHHLSVLSREIIAGLNILPQGHYLDVTAGGGGHSELILNSSSEVQVTAIDRDANAIAATSARLAEYIPHRLQFWQGNFADYEPQDYLFDGIIADLGVSSPQFDTPERGFSFSHAAPLDMR
ncbi:MAG: 16S rRNA (cytosine(1402)-N(4))-methyltransferase, partial [Xenococcus sp. (in: cyanobacteria)]